MGPGVIGLIVQRFMQVKFGRVRVTEFFVKSSQFDPCVGQFWRTENPTLEQLKRLVSTSSLHQKHRQLTVAFHVVFIQREAPVVQSFGFRDGLFVSALDPSTMQCGGQIVMGVSILGIRLDGRAEALFRRDILSRLKFAYALNVLTASQHVASRRCGENRHDGQK
jgi:hypothetical protein